MQEASNYPANKTGQALRGREGFGCPWRSSCPIASARLSSLKFLPLFRETLTYVMKNMAHTCYCPAQKASYHVKKIHYGFSAHESGFGLAAFSSAHPDRAQSFDCTHCVVASHLNASLCPLIQRLAA
jgi:hypothetical protein